MAVFVVEALEVVDVQHGDTDGKASAPSAGELALKLLVPGAPVR
jgi:hypothetical protein